MKKIMVCVTQQKNCDRLIDKAHKLKSNEEDELIVIHIVKENWKYFGQLKESDALEFLFDRAKNYNATLSVYKAKDIEGKLADFAEKESVDMIVMGETREKTKQQNMIKRLQAKTQKEVQFEIVPHNYEIEGNGY